MHTSTQILVSTRPVLLALVKGGPQGPPGPGTGAPVRLTFSSTVNTAALGDADIYACIDTSAARTLTISTETIQQGTPTRPRVITVTDDSGGAGTNNITIDTEGAQTIDGAPSAVIVVGYGTVALLSDGSNLSSTGGGSGKTNAVDRVPVTTSPSTIVDVYSAADLPAAVVAPDGVLRVPLARNTGYLIHSTFVWPRLLLPTAEVSFEVTEISSLTLNPSMLISGDGTPHIYGRNISFFHMRGIAVVDISNLGAGRGTVLFDLTGGSDDAALITLQSPFVNFARLGHLVDVPSPIQVPILFNNLGGGFVSEFTGTFELSGFQTVGANFNQVASSAPALKPMWSFVGLSSGVGIVMGLGGINLNPADSGFYIDPAFDGTLSLVSNGYNGTMDGSFFRPDVSIGLLAEGQVDKPVTSFSADVRAIVSVSPGAGSVFNAGARHNWRVGDSLTHSGFTNAGYNGTVTITDVDPFTYTVGAVPFVGGDSGTATHDLSTLVTSAGHGLYRNQTVLLGGATPGAYAGLRAILAVEDDEDGFTIPVAFSVGGTGTIQVTRVTTASDHPMVRGETATIIGTASYHGTRPILATPADDQFDISAAFVIDEGVTGSVASSTLDETGIPIQALGNGAQKDSKSIGSVVANGNAAATVITVVNTWTDLNIGGLAVAGSNIERWGSVDATTGEATYNDNSDFSGEMRTSMSVTSQGSNQRFQFRAVVNGSPLSDGVVASVDLSNSPMISVSLIAPIQCSTGDTVRVQVQNTSGTSNVFVQDLSMIIS